LHQNLLQKAIFIRQFISKVVSQLSISTTINDLEKDFKVHLNNSKLALKDLLNLLEKQQKIKDSSYTTEEIMQLISNNELTTSNISTTSTRPTFNSKRKYYSPTINSKRKCYSLTPLQNYIHNNFKQTENISFLSSKHNLILVIYI